MCLHARVSYTLRTFAAYHTITLIGDQGRLMRDRTGALFGVSDAKRTVRAAKTENGSPRSVSSRSSTCRNTELSSTGSSLSLAMIDISARTRRGHIIFIHDYLRLRKVQLASFLPSLGAGSCESLSHPAAFILRIPYFVLRTSDIVPRCRLWFCAILCFPLPPPLPSFPPQSFRSTDVPLELASLIVALAAV